MQAKSTHNRAIRGTTFLKTLQTAPKKPLSSNPLSCRYRIVPGSTVEVGSEPVAPAPSRPENPWNRSEEFRVSRGW